jgi:hypothetical protein
LGYTQGLTLYYISLVGFDVYSDRYAEQINEVQKTFDPPQPFNDIAVLEKVQKEMIKKTPLDKLKERYEWRDGRLSALSKLINDMDDADANKI